jgi:hypothetical protein
MAAEALAEAREAAALLGSPLLGEILGEMREAATRDAIGGDDAAVREESRQLVLAIDGLMSRLRARVDAGRMQEHRDARRSTLPVR